MQFADKIYNIENINTAIFNILGKSVEYKNLLDKIEYLEQDMLYTVEGDWKIEKSKKLNEKKEELKQFKIEVIRLAEAFTKIEINTERIQIAKSQFENGCFFDANETLKEEDLKTSQELLLKRKSEEEAKLNRQLEINSEEWLIKARLTALNYDVRDRYKLAKHFFESALLSYQSPKNFFEYAIFLEENLQYNDAYSIVNKAENLFKNSNTESNESEYKTLYIKVLYLKGKLENALGMYSQAEYSYKSSLTLNKELSDKDYLDSRKQQIKILNGLSALYLKVKEFESTISYSNQAILIYKEKPDDLLEIKAEYGIANDLLASALACANRRNVEIPWHEKYKIGKQIEKLKDVYLTIFDELSKINPDKYSTEVIKGLEYKARYARTEGKNDEAKKYFLKGIELAQKQSNKNPEIYLPILSRSLEAYAEFQSNIFKNYSEAKCYMEQALKITEDLYKVNPEAYLYVLATQQINLAAVTEGDDIAFALISKAHDNFKILQDKNPELYREDFILCSYKVFIRQKGLKEFNKAEKSILDLQEYLLSLINKGQNEQSYRYLNSFFVLSEMFKIELRNKSKSLYYANLGMEKLDIGFLPIDDLTDIKNKLTTIISYWQKR